MNTSTATPRLDRVEDVFVLHLGDTENRFHPDWVAAVDDALEQVERATGPRGLVTTATGKFFSNGLDLEWLAANLDRQADYVTAVERLFARALCLPVVSVTAIGGHAFAAGAMLSLAHDFRVMRADRGFWCLPEVDIDIPFTPGMSALITSRLAPRTAHEAMTTGRRYGGLDALDAGIVDRAVDEDDVLPVAMSLAAVNAAKAGATLATIKQRMYQHSLATLAG